MIDSRLRLSVLHDDNGTFADYSEEAVDFARDAFSISLATVDHLYVGYRKPIGSAYCELATANVNANTLAMQYWNGSTWTALEDARDLTKGLTRSGWLTWTKPSDWEESAVNGSTKYWVRITPSADHAATSVSGLNLILADDYDLQTIFPSVVESGFLPAGETSHVKTHVGARNQIIQDLRNRGYVKVDANGDWQNLTPWDLHDVEEVRQAATYLALSLIFFNYSDNPQDNWAAKAKSYEDKYKAQLDKLTVSIDADDDGKKDKAEQRRFTVVRMSR